MFGLLNIEKPPGLTSRDAVDQVQRLVRPWRAGHAGTLDPLATGVLIILVGPATRLTEYLHRYDKEYEAQFLLGQISDTEDVTGAVQPLSDAPRPTEAAIQGAAALLVGEIQQRPPAFSALRVGGRRAYDLARRGQPAALPTRPVVVHGIEIVRYDYPLLELRVRCGTGTYVRSLGRDLAESLGTGATMSRLCRTRIGPFPLDQSVALSRLSSAEEVANHLHPPHTAIQGLPTVTLDARQARDLSFARPLTLAVDPQSELAAVNADGELLAVLAYRPTGTWHPAKNFIAAHEAS